MAVVLKVALILARVCVFSDVFVLLEKLFSFVYLHPCSEGKVSMRILSLITLNEAPILPTGEVRSVTFQPNTNIHQNVLLSRLTTTVNHAYHTLSPWTLLVTHRYFLCANIFQKTHDPERPRLPPPGWRPPRGHVLTKERLGPR